MMAPLVYIRQKIEKPSNFNLNFSYRHANITDKLNLPSNHDFTPLRHLAIKQCRQTPQCDDQIKPILSTPQRNANERRWIFTAVKRRRRNDIQSLLTRIRNKIERQPMLGQRLPKMDAAAM